MVRAMRWFAAAAVAAVLPAPAVLSAQTHAHGSEQTMNDIVTVAVEAGSFGTLVKAVQAAGLVETLKGEGPFTVFAPTDEAFAQLPAGTVEALLNDPDRLREVLTYHVVPGRVTSADLVRQGGATPTTVNGQRLPIRVDDSGVEVGGATVTTADVEASNGVIHVIDRVLLPSMAGAAAGR